MSLQHGQVDPMQLDRRELLVAVAVLGGGGLAVGAVSLLSSFAAAAAVGRMVAERALGREYRASQAWDFTLGKLWRLAGGGIVAGLALTAGYMVGAIPAAIVSLILMAATGGMQPGAEPSPVVQIVPSIVILPVLLAVAAYLSSMPSVVAVEDVGGISAVFRSFRLVAGRFRQAATTVGLGAVILMGPGTVLQMVGQFVLFERLTEALGGGLGMLAAFGPGTAVGLVVSPIIFVLQALIYFDLRSRQTEEDFTPYELTLEVGGELPEGVSEPFASAAATDSSAPADIS